MSENLLKIEEALKEKKDLKQIFDCKLQWKPPSLSFPENPEKGWAFLYGPNRQARIYDGEQWAIMADVDGNIAEFPLPNAEKKTK
jgi:hypothetical protein